jgi:hypothetical protein
MAGFFWLIIVAGNAGGITYELATGEIHGRLWAVLAAVAWALSLYFVVREATER